PPRTDQAAPGIHSEILYEWPGHLILELARMISWRSPIHSCAGRSRQSTQVGWPAPSVSGHRLLIGLDTASAHPPAWDRRLEACQENRESGPVDSGRTN